MAGDTAEESARSQRLIREGMRAACRIDKQGEEQPREKAREQAFAEVKDEHRPAANLAHGADGVRGSDIAASVIAHVSVIEDAGDDHSPRNRPQDKRRCEQKHQNCYLIQKTNPSS